MIPRQSPADNLDLFPPCLLINSSTYTGECFWVKVAKRGKQRRRNRCIADAHFSNTKKLCAGSHFRSGKFDAYFHGLHCGERRHRRALSKICRSSSNFSVQQSWRSREEIVIDSYINNAHGNTALASKDGNRCASTQVIVDHLRGDLARVCTHALFTHSMIRATDKEDFFMNKRTILTANERTAEGKFF
jgi:hypothetical protein